MNKTFVSCSPNLGLLHLPKRSFFSVCGKFSVSVVCPFFSCNFLCLQPPETTQWSQKSSLAASSSALSSPFFLYWSSNYATEWNSKVHISPSFSPYLVVCLGHNHSNRQIIYVMMIFWIIFKIAALIIVL